MQSLIGTVFLLPSFSSVAFGSAPPARYTITNGTVTDVRTGLVWQQIVDDVTYTQAAAASHCSDLALGGYSSGWRLPTIAELISIVDYTVEAPAIDLSVFRDTPREVFWSSSRYGKSSDTGWFVQFGTGWPSANAVSMTFRVRCVH